jgi:hypothetical protein
MRRADAITTGLVIAFLLSMVIPDYWRDRFHFGEVPLGAIVLAALFSVLLVKLLRKPGAISLGLVGGFVALITTTFLGYFRENIETYSLKFFVADVFCLAALLAGYAVARTQTKESTARMVSWSALAASAAICATYIGLYTGVVIQELDAPGRTVTVSIYYAVAVVLVLLAWSSVSADLKSTTGGWRTYILFATAAGTAMLSATRSTTIEVVLAPVLFLIVKRKQFGRAFLLRATVGAGLLFVLAIWGLPYLGTFVFTRLNDTNLADETRTEELSLWWPQVQDDIIVGQGMGSRFVSNIVAEGSTLASTPHIGIVTFLMKGGILLFLGYAVLPLFFAVSVLLSGNSSETQRGAASSVVMFVCIASLSGGWAPLPMFFYGLAIASMNPERQRRASSSVRYRVRTSSFDGVTAAERTQ